jgi:hypothetical protein
LTRLFAEDSSAIDVVQQPPKIILEGLAAVPE